MRKFINWYSISVIVILSIGARILLVSLGRMESTGEDFKSPFYILGLFIVFIILSIVGIITGSPKGNANKLYFDPQERTSDPFPSRPEIAIISFAIAITVTFAISFLINWVYMPFNWVSESLFMATIITLFVVALYSVSGRFRK